MLSSVGQNKIKLKTKSWLCRTRDCLNLDSSVGCGSVKAAPLEASVATFAGFPRWSVAEGAGEQFAATDVAGRGDEFAQRLTNLILAKYLEELLMQSDGELCNVGVEAMLQIEEGHRIDLALRRVRWTAWQQECNAVDSLIVHYRARCGDFFDNELDLLCKQLRRNRMQASNRLISYLDQLLRVEMQKGLAAAVKEASKMRKEFEQLISDLQARTEATSIEKERITNIIFDIVDSINELVRTRTIDVLPALRKLCKNHKRRHIGLGTMKALSAAGSIAAAPLLFLPPLVPVGLVCGLCAYGTHVLTTLGDVAANQMQERQFDKVIQRDIMLSSRVEHLLGELERTLQHAHEGLHQFPSVGIMTDASRGACIIALVSAHASTTAFAGFACVGAVASMADLIRYVASGRAERERLRQILGEVQKANETLERIREVFSQPRALIPNMRVRRSVDTETRILRNTCPACAGDVNVAASVGDPPRAHLPCLLGSRSHLPIQPHMTL